jgi:integrase
VETEAANLLTQLATGAYIESTRETVGAYLVRWLEATEATVRPATVARYQAQITNHLIPAFGSLGVTRLTPAHIQTFYATKLRAGLSPTTVRLFHMLLHRALDQAVKWRLIPYNPCDAVEPPRKARPVMQTWNAASVRTILTGSDAHPLGALFRLALMTGMRKGELLALRWQEIDLERGTLAVRRSLTRDRDDRWIIGEPKTAAGRRAIALPASCVAALKRHQRRQTERMMKHRDVWHADGLVFDRGDGALLHPNVADQQFQREANRLTLPRIRFHDMRHTAATLMLAEGVHPKIVCERLGHSSIAMTLDRYSHVSIDMQRDAADRLDAALGA